MSQISNLSSTILNIKTDIKNAIINKGQNVNDLFSSYPNAIMNISGGSAQGIKVFDSIANMQSDINSQTGDLAIVYHSTIDNITESTQFSEGTFPETVTLSTAVTDYIQLQFKAVDESIMFDCWGEIGSDYMRMSCYADDGSGNYKEYRIEYTSSDGLTYTRTRFQIDQEDISSNVMDFDTVIVFGSRWGEPTWDDRIGSFIKAGTTSFEGMYKHNGTNYNWANTGLTLNSSEKVYKGKFYGNNIITNGTWVPTTNLNLNQLKDKVNLYNNLSYMTVKNNESLGELFISRTDLKAVPNINMSNVSNASRIFCDCSNLAYVPDFDSSGVTNMSEMFHYCRNLTSVPNLNTDNVTNMTYMFAECYNLVNVSNFNTSNVVNMYGMFQRSNNLTSAPNFNTSNVTNIGCMFCDCNNLISVPNFNTSKVISMDHLFTNCMNLVNVPDFDTSNVTSMNAMFWTCPNLTRVPNLNTDNVTTMSYMFELCYNITTIPNFNTSKVTNMANFLSSCTNLTEIPNFDTSNVTNMSTAFTWMHKITSIPNFNTSKVTNMATIFRGDILINTIPELDTSNVTNFAKAIDACYNVTSLPNLNTSKVTDMYYAVSQTKITSFPNWDLSNVYNVSGMFAFCSELGSFPLVNLNKASNIVNMFDRCNNLSSAAYANIANSLPHASQLSNKYLASTGLNLQKFNSTQNTILKNKGYLEFQQNYYTIVYS